MSDTMRALVPYFRALADASRLRLLALMNAGPLCVEDLAVALAVPQPRVSRHLAYLRRAGLVDSQRQGRRIYYRIVSPPDLFARRIMDTLQRQLAQRAAVQADRRRLTRTMIR
jgi:ArsR family transcriptional regulator, arsenate/arsenite/antimonite-responsive transcriptional repressor